MRIEREEGRELRLWPFARRRAVVAAAVLFAVLLGAVLGMQAGGAMGTD